MLRPGPHEDLRCLLRMVEPYHKIKFDPGVRLSDLLLASFHQQILKVQKCLLRCVHIDKRRRYSCLSASTSPPYLMHIVFDLLRHGENDNVLDVVEIQSLGRNTGSNHDIFCTCFEGLDSILTFFLSCNAQSVRIDELRVGTTRRTL